MQRWLQDGNFKLILNAIQISLKSGSQMMVKTNFPLKSLNFSFGKLQFVSLAYLSISHITDKTKMHYRMGHQRKEIFQE